MKKNEDQAAKKKPKTSAAQIRVQKGASPASGARVCPTDTRNIFVDQTELDLPSTMVTTFPDPADLLNFNLTITPDEGTHSLFSQSSVDSIVSKGMYKSGSFLFTFKINANYPHEPPKVKCEQKVRCI